MRLLTDAEHAVLEQLIDAPDGATASQVGSTLWGRQHRKPQHYARPAGRILRRLQRRGHVELSVDTWLRVVWRLTLLGSDSLKEDR